MTTTPGTTRQVSVSRVITALSATLEQHDSTGEAPGG
jgi:hypothetical protein